ncbi:MAG: glycerol-3-phosphate responsive antiterminator, partial [Oscillospiraceae bacterium]|nr:glycerol-3-phosphate responsive antiterminator [Candidatus Equicaccousia limihippi]
MSVQDIKKLLSENPVIAAVPQSRIDIAINSSCPVIFVLRSNVLTLKQRISAAHEHGKKVFVHIDLCEGLGRDKSGVELLRIFGADGILSTHAQLIKEAKNKGLCTVQRFFALDSKGIGDMAEQMLNSSPDFVEIMPGIAT